MQYKSQESAKHAKSLDGKGNSHSNAPEAGMHRADTSRLNPLANPLIAGTFAGAAQRSVQAMSDAVVSRARKSAGAANNYVHEQPWKFIGAAAAGGLLLGFLLARRN